MCTFYQSIRVIKAVKLLALFQQPNSHKGYTLHLIEMLILWGVFWIHDTTLVWGLILSDLNFWLFIVCSLPRLLYCCNVLLSYNFQFRIGKYQQLLQIALAEETHNNVFFVAKIFLQCKSCFLLAFQIFIIISSEFENYQ